MVLSATSLKGNRRKAQTQSYTKRKLRVIWLHPRCCRLASNYGRGCNTLDLRKKQCTSSSETLTHQDTMIRPAAQLWCVLFRCLWEILTVDLCSKHEHLKYFLSSFQDLDCLAGPRSAATGSSHLLCSYSTLSTCKDC